MKTAWRLLPVLTLLIFGISASAETPCIYIAGDSTASNGAENGCVAAGILITTSAAHSSFSFGLLNVCEP